MFTPSKLLLVPCCVCIALLLAPFVRSALTALSVQHGLNSGLWKSGGRRSAYRVGLLCHGNPLKSVCVAVPCMSAASTSSTVCMYQWYWCVLLYDWNCKDLSKLSYYYLYWSRDMPSTYSRKSSFLCLFFVIFFHYWSFFALFSVTYIKTFCSDDFFTPLVEQCHPPPPP